jgi:ribosomal protein S3
VTDDSAFKQQVRARMAATGEKYTVARRMVIAEAAIRDAVRRSIEQDTGLAAAEVGVAAVEVDVAADPVRVTIRAARPELAWGLRRSRETEDGLWRESAAELLHRELRELTGRRVRLDIRQEASDFRRGA